ncbi:classical arabinogalactan protein 26-like [Miscanthus floridulus]|uniref:classical arabinogalactan protein 26-like n=1 Tax=Miscanthus floridulus TaxID=154761 RepID=UPI00345B3DAC
MARARGRGRGCLLLLLAFLAGAAAGRHDAPAPRASSISAAPEYPPLPRLPNQHHGRHAAGPALPPALSPDIMPVLPSPAEDGAAPVPDAGEPTIPSSPSPPNPDALEPDSALAPFGSAPAVAAQSHAVASASASALPLLGLLAMWLLLVVV